MLGDRFHRAAKSVENNNVVDKLGANSSVERKLDAKTGVLRVERIRMRKEEKARTENKENESGNRPAEAVPAAPIARIIQHEFAPTHRRRLRALA